MTTLFMCRTLRLSSVSSALELARGWLAATVVVMLAALLLSGTAFTADGAEWRAFWVDGWGAGFLNQSQVDALLGIPGTSIGGQIRDANCNAVIVQVRRRADVCYPSGMGEPYMSGLTPTNFNALQAMINAAHDTTGGKKRLEVHCWMVAFKTGKGQVYSQHSDPPTGSLTTFDNYWPTRRSSSTGAENSDGALDPGHPKCLEYLVNVCMDLVNNFAVDGIHYDYIRFEANTEGYNPTSVARYNARYGLSGNPASSSNQFKQWRRDQVTALVRQVYARIQKSKPWVRQSGSFVTWNPSPTGSTRAAFQATRPYYDVYSDWDSWIQEGIVDMAVPMTYYDWDSLPNDYTRWMNWEKDRKGNRHMIVGPGVYLNTLPNALYVLLLTRNASPAGNHADGFSGYSYRVPYENGVWADFSPSLVSQVTPTWDDIPPMPWKTSPATGHIMGAVTNIVGTDTNAVGVWADGATVTLTGPISRSQSTDGTGFYAFIDLPPGSYTIAVSKVGYFNAQAVVKVAVGEVAGEMYQQDFVLAPTTSVTITAQPLSQGVSLGGDATFTVAANGTPPLYFQWRFWGTNLPGATDASFTRSQVQLADAGPYSVVVTNAFSGAVSSNAALAVITLPAITAQPQPAAVPAGQSAAFTVAATGTPPLGYQWRFNGEDLAGATATALTLPFVCASNVGAYSVVVNNDYGAVFSSDALLTLLPAASGDDTFGQSITPASASNVVALAAGAWHSLALRADGTVVAWGDNSSGQTDVPPDLQDALAIAAGGYHGLALRAGGTVVAWGANEYGQATVPAGLDGAIAIAAGTWHSVALLAAGTVVVWGDNSFGQTSLPAGLTDVTAVAAGGNHTLALKADGTVVAWGENTDAGGNMAGQSSVPRGLANVAAIAAGEYHSLAARADGTVVAWGDNGEQQCGVPSGLAEVVAVAGGGAHSLALKSDGTIVAWGANWQGQCDLSPLYFPANAMAAGGYHTVVLVEGTIPEPCLMNPARDADRFTAWIQTLNRKHYALEYKDSLSVAVWTAIATNTGSGALQMLSDPTATAAPRFYRMRQW